jgi:hypothetical protein
VRNERDDGELFRALDDDDKLLAALREAMRRRDAVPTWFVEVGKNAYAWHDIDAELAQLTYDSHNEEHLTTATRSETASVRALTFTSDTLSMELEVTEDGLLGQIIPPLTGTLEIHTKAGAITTATVDDIGFFTVKPMPDSPFRLRCQTTDGTDVISGWITS